MGWEPSMRRPSMSGPSLFQVEHEIPVLFIPVRHLWASCITQNKQAKVILVAPNKLKIDCFIGCREK